MNPFTRGQETYLSHLRLTLFSLFRLLFAGVFTGGLAAAGALYITLPQRFWEKAFRIFYLPFTKRGRSQYKTFFLALENAQKKIERLCYDYEIELFEGCAAGLLTGILFTMMGYLFFSSQGKALLDPLYLRGSQLISPKAFNRAYRALISREVKEIRQDNKAQEGGSKVSKKDFSGTPFPLGADGILLPEFALYRHVGIVGTTGTGKSTLIKSYLNYARKKGEKVLIPDINGEYKKDFYQEGDTVLSLSDEDSAHWDFSAEKSVEAGEFAKFLVPSGDEKNAFWWKGARQVVRQLLEKTNSAKELWELIESDEGGLSEQLSGIAKKILGKEGSAQAAGITGSSILDFAFLETLAGKALDKEKPLFSIFDWVQNKESSWIFLTFRDTEKELASPLLRLWTNTAILSLLRREQQTLPPFNLVIDEVTSLGKVELLPLSLERGRKYRGKVLLGYQSESQIRGLYGPHEAASIRANTGTRCIFRSPEAEEARKLSDFLGRQEIKRKDTAMAYGRFKQDGGENITFHESTKNIVLDSEIRDLPDGHFYLKSLNIHPTRSRVKKIFS